MKRSSLEKAQTKPDQLQVKDGESGGQVCQFKFCLTFTYVLLKTKKKSFFLPYVAIFAELWWLKTTQGYQDNTLHGPIALL